MTTATVSVRVPGELKEQLEALSDATHRSKSYLVAKALKEFVHRNAWKTEELQKAIKGADKGIFVSGKAVNNWLESWGTPQEKSPPEADTLLK